MGELGTSLAGEDRPLRSAVGGRENTDWFRTTAGIGLPLKRGLGELSRNEHHADGLGGHDSAVGGLTKFLH